MSETDQTPPSIGLPDTPVESVRPPLGRLLGPVADVPNALSLFGITLVDSAGAGLYLGASALYFNIVVGLSASQVGFGLSLGGILGLVAQPLIGRAADRWRVRTVLIALHIWRAVGFLAFLVARDFTTFVVATAIVGVGQQALSPVYQALVSEIVTPELRVPFMARTRVFYNVGFSIGALLATGAISRSTTTFFNLTMLGTALACLIVAGLLAMLAGTPPATRRAPKSAFSLGALADLPYLSVAAVNGLLSLHMSLLAVGIPLWVVLHSRAPHALVGLLMVLNAVMAVLLQVRASRNCDSVSGSATTLRHAGTSLVMCCLLLVATAKVHAMVPAVILLLLAVIALTAAELFQSAAGWGLSFLLAPEQGRAEYLATFNLGAGTQYVLGPTIVTVGVIQHGTAGWIVLAGVIAIAALLVGPLAKRAELRQR
jgi:MFS family permease